jgi:hypothetical protein
MPVGAATERRDYSVLANHGRIRWSEELNSPEPSFARRLGAFDATMIVMGGIIGASLIQR